MARKHVIASFKLFDDEAVSADIQSTTVKTDLTDLASIELNWSASTLAANVEVQAKNGKNGAWRALALGSVPTISGASGSHDIILTELPFTELRVALTSVTGSGTVNAVITSKSKGS